MKRYKPNKNTHAVLWFDIKRGTWLGDVDVLREAIKRGLKKEGLNNGVACLRYAYKDTNR